MEKLPQSMAAVDIKGGHGPASALVASELPVPVAGDGQVVIRVFAAGINRPDVFQRMGYYPPPPGAPATLGLEVSGEIVAASGRWKLGDRVVALLGGGGYAEYVVADANHVLPHPETLDAISAAALPETVFTVFANVFEDGKLRAGQTLLVHGANSGIGTTAIQMAKAAGATVIATARGPDKVKAALDLGADVAIDVKADTIGGKVKSVLGLGADAPGGTTSGSFAEIANAHGGVDVILDMVGGDYFAGNLQALKPHGRIIYIAGLSGMEITVPIMALMAKRAVITGSTLRSRTSEEKSALAKRVEEVVWPWIAEGKLRPQIDSTFPLAEAAAAHERMESGSHGGKIVLTVAGPGK
ncbi:NAD(P)H-quinone oxidoreductase [Sphingomonas bacterium]|uniref:NAD(P)H-quinone oxidoreductase n=1 Tax=Sphingomonas bacterium TaxID=1895847 RepID=UPI001C2D512C|nr:NAD(P)H-quinone oxidoreductase [Sphingomonas bacterium]